MIIWIREAWREVSEDTIKNCWGHAGILPLDHALAIKQDDVRGIKSAEKAALDGLSELIGNLKLADALDAETYINPPAEQDVQYTLSEEEIMAAVGKMALAGVAVGSAEWEERLDEVVAAVIMPVDPAAAAEVAAEGRQDQEKVLTLHDARAYGAALVRFACSAGMPQEDQDAMSRLCSQLDGLVVAKMAKRKQADIKDYFPRV